MTSTGGTAGPGTVYKIAPGTNHVTILHNFGDGTVLNDGEYPTGSLAIGSDGTLYGFTDLGGASNHGTVFKITPAGKETVLHSFAGGSDGSGPDSEDVRHVRARASRSATTACSTVRLSTAGSSAGTAGSHGGGTVFSVRTDGTD